MELLGLAVFLILLILIVGILEKYGGFIFFTIMFLGLIYLCFKGFMNEIALKKAQEEARRREEEARKRQEEYQIQQYEANQKYVLQCLERSITDSHSIFQRLPGELVSAEKALDKAEQEFAGNYYAPFWEAMEDAVNHLGTFCIGIQQIENHHRNYKEQRKNLDSRPPSFPSFHFPEPRARATADRLKSIDRHAQSNIHFATIYQQRKTNQLLIMGFTSLAQAIDGMGSRISSSINDLSRSMSEKDKDD